MSVHVVPVGDIVLHEASSECLCGPTLDLESQHVWIHHALDGREQHEDRIPGMVENLNRMFDEES